MAAVVACGLPAGDWPRGSVLPETRQQADADLGDFSCLRRALFPPDLLYWIQASRRRDGMERTSRRRYSAARGDGGMARAHVRLGLFPGQRPLQGRWRAAAGDFAGGDDG